jgi:PRTRC genetic system protein E
MFAELMPLLRKRDILFTVSLVEADTIRATVVPCKSSDSEDNAVTTPLAITGTADELDHQLPSQLVEFVGAHLQLQSTLSAAKAEIDMAAKAAREEARKKTTKPAVTSTATAPRALEPPPPDPPPLFANQVAPDAATTESNCDDNNNNGGTTP